jgi:hypothetical protein
VVEEVDDADRVVRRTMLLFLMIPLSLVACTIALGPILACVLLRDAERLPAATRLPWGIDGADDAPVSDAAVRDPDRVCAA